MAITTIQEARQEFAEVVLLANPGRRRIKNYVASNKELVVMFTAKRYLPDLARQASLRIQAAEEYLNNK